MTAPTVTVPAACLRGALILIDLCIDDLSERELDQIRVLETELLKVVPDAFDPRPTER